MLKIEKIMGKEGSRVDFARELYVAIVILTIAIRFPKYSLEVLFYWFYINEGK